MLATGPSHGALTWRSGLLPRGLFASLYSGFLNAVQITGINGTRQSLLYINGPPQACKRGRIFPAASSPCGANGVGSQQPVEERWRRQGLASAVDRCNRSLGC